MRSMLKLKATMDEILSVIRASNPLGRGGWIVSKQVELSHENWPLRPYWAGNISRFTIRHKSRGQWGKFPYYFCRQPTPIRAPGNTFQRVIHCSSISTVFQIVDLSRWIRIKRGEGELGCGTVSIEIAVPDRVPKLSTLNSCAFNPNGTLDY